MARSEFQLGTSHFLAQNRCEIFICWNCGFQRCGRCDCFSNSFTKAQESNILGRGVRGEGKSVRIQVFIEFTIGLFFPFESQYIHIYKKMGEMDGFYFLFLRRFLASSCFAVSRSYDLSSRIRAKNAESASFNGSAYFCCSASWRNRSSRSKPSRDF